MEDIGTCEMTLLNMFPDNHACKYSLFMTNLFGWFMIYLSELYKDNASYILLYLCNCLSIYPTIEIEVFVNWWWYSDHTASESIFINNVDLQHDVFSNNWPLS